jgi:O-antigen ligase
LLLFILPFAHNISLRWLAALATVAIALWRWQARFAVPPLPCKLPIAFWLATLLLSIPWAHDPWASFSELKVDVLYSLLLFTAFFVLTQSARELQVWLTALAAGSFTVSLVAIVSFVRHGAWVPGEQNALGEFATCMVTALPAIVLLSVRNMPWSQRSAWARYLLPVMLLAGVLTLSRMFLGALILMLLANAILQAWRRRLNLRQIFVVTVSLFAVLAAAGVAIMAQQRGLQLASDLRPAIWQVAIQRIAEHPWLGAGYGRLLDADVYRQAFPGELIFHPHNLLLGFAAQAGIFAAVGIVLVFYALGREYWRMVRADSRVLAYVGIAGLVMLTGVLAKNMTDMFFVRECALLFWAINGALLGFAARAARSQAQNTFEQARLEPA